MRRNMQLSKVGLKLIKAYEGYRPVDRYLVNGHHVVGYGHIIEGDDSLVLTRKEAEDVLRRDLEPYEDMVNETVHAPLSQSQFDALVSLAFNIGPRAFTDSDTLRALNNGRPLDAAIGFDVWRKSTINGKTYVVDALMRRRAAEKALFLRTEGKKTLPASRADLPPVKDEMAALLTTEDALPVISNDPRNGFVARVPYAAQDVVEPDLATGPDGEDSALERVDFDEDMSEKSTSVSAALSASEPQITLDIDDRLQKGLSQERVSQEDVPAYGRRRDDGPSGILELSEIYDDDVPRQRGHGLDDDLVDTTYEVFTDDDYEDETQTSFDLDVETDKTSEPAEPSSLIADTASQLSGRLDALIDNVAGDTLEPSSDNWPESLIQASDDVQTDIDDVQTDITETVEIEIVDPDTIDYGSDDVAPDTASAETGDIVIDNLIEDDAFRERSDSAAKYINIAPEQAPKAVDGGFGYFIPLLIGMSLTGASAGAIFGNPTAILGEWGPLLSFVGLVVGIIMTIFTIYYVLRTKK